VKTTFTVRLPKRAAPEPMIPHTSDAAPLHH
jgi:hypothetical protein